MILFDNNKKETLKDILRNGLVRYFDVYHQIKLLDAHELSMQIADQTEFSKLNCTVNEEQHKKEKIDLLDCKLKYGFCTAIYNKN